MRVSDLFCSAFPYDTPFKRSFLERIEAVDDQAILSLIADLIVYSQKCRQEERLFLIGQIQEQLSKNGIKLQIPK